MKQHLVRVLLSILNSRFLNSTPCNYEFVGNIDAFSRSHLASEESQQPGITVKQVLEDADRFKSCPLNNGMMVIDGGEYREATVWDVHQLRTELTRKPIENPDQQ